MALIDQLASSAITELGLTNPAQALREEKVIAFVRRSLGGLTPDQVANLPEEQLTSWQHDMVPKGNPDAKHRLLAALAIQHQIHHQLGGCDCPPGS